MSNSDTFVIIDGNAIIHRAYHAIPPLSKNGVSVNAVYGFLSMLLKVYHDLKPTYIAVCFDVAGGTFRDKIFTEYKAKRVKADQDLYDQIPLVREAVAAFGIQIFSHEGYEADDVIGTITANVKPNSPSSGSATSPKSEGPKVKTVVVTGDMDLLQLINENTSVYLLRKGLSDTALFGKDQVFEKYGFPPDRVVDYKALRGDASDNIPGVPGIGEKTATALLQKIGGMAEIYADLKKTGSKTRAEFSAGVVNKLIAGEASAELSFEIATIHTGVPNLGFALEACAVSHYTREAAIACLQKFEFMSLVKRLPGGATATDTVTATPTKIEHATDINKLSVITIEAKNWPDLWSKLLAATEFSVKEVVAGTDDLAHHLLGLVFVIMKAKKCEAFFVSWEHLPAKNIAWTKLFADDKKILVGHDVKEVVKALLAQDIEVKNQLADTMIASYVLNSSTRAHSAADLALRELQIILPETTQASLFGTGADVAATARELAVATAVWPKLAEQLLARNDRGVFDKIEMTLIPVLARMESAGVALDTKRLRELSGQAEETIKRLTKHICQEAGEEFNVASSTQLREILYEKLDLKIPGIKKGKTGYSTAASELEKLRGAHPIIELIEEYREIAKLQNTYLSVLPNLINAETGRLHTHYNQAVAATGRLSSVDPNLQNIPIRTELGRQVRDAFISTPGHKLITADYSQIELRIVASLAQDEELMGIFARGEDVHRATAAAIHDVSLDKVTKEMRYAAKEVNFGVLYGMGAYGLAWRAGIPQAEAKMFIETYFKKFAGVKKYLDETVKFARETGYVETLFGRRRYIPELASGNFQLRAAGERMAINMPVQGTAADIMKLAMIGVDQAIRSDKKYGAHPSSAYGLVKMILQVHDELVIEAPAELAVTVGELVQAEMIAAAKLHVPVEVTVSVGERWGEMK